MVARTPLARGEHDLADSRPAGALVVSRPEAQMVGLSHSAVPSTAQSSALEQPDVHRVLVPHPIQDRTDEELRQLARGAVDRIVAKPSG